MQNAIHNNSLALLSTQCPYTIDCPVRQSAATILEKIIAKLQNTKTSESLQPKFNDTSRYVSSERGKFQHDSLTRLRQEHQLTKEELAHLLDVDLITIKHWESGRFTPTPRMQKRILNLENTGSRKIKKLLLSRLKQAHQTPIVI